MGKRKVFGKAPVIEQLSFLLKKHLFI